MVIGEKNSNTSWRLLSWEKSMNNLYRVQKRLFKAVCVADFKKALQIQKLILTSNSVRLLAIREVTQVSSIRKVPGIDGKTSLSFTERFELNEFVKYNFVNWEFNKLRRISLISKDGRITKFDIPTISDRVWQALIKFVIEPANEVSLHPRNYGFRNSCTIHHLQKLVFLNLSKESFGIQKRFLLLETILVFDISKSKLLLEKIIAPRSVKLGIFRSFLCGICPNFNGHDSSKYNSDITFLYANIILNGIEKIHPSVRFGYLNLFFLKPFHDERSIVNKVNIFFENLGIQCNIKDIQLFSSSQGFNFLDWHFKIDNSGNSFSTPSFDNYQMFLKRIKYIINNSNYGSVRYYICF